MSARSKGLRVEGWEFRDYELFVLFVYSCHSWFYLIRQKCYHDSEPCHWKKWGNWVFFDLPTFCKFCMLIVVFGKRYRNGTLSVHFCRWSRVNRASSVFMTEAGLWSKCSIIFIGFDGEKCEREFELTASGIVSFFSYRRNDGSRTCCQLVSGRSHRVSDETCPTEVHPALGQKGKFFGSDGCLWWWEQVACFWTVTSRFWRNLPLRKSIHKNESHSWLHHFLFLFPHAFALPRYGVFGNLRTNVLKLTP